MESNRLRAFEALREAGIGVNVHYIPVHTQPFYRARGFGPGDFRKAEAYYARAISLPMFPGLTNSEQSAIVNRLTTTLANLTAEN
jgi:dTDP-4-amino-4,6-dideoxygalactose transaminase